MRGVLLLSLILAIAPRAAEEPVSEETPGLPSEDAPHEVPAADEVDIPWPVLEPLDRPEPGFDPGSEAWTEVDSAATPIDDEADQPVEETAPPPVLMPAFTQEDLILATRESVAPLVAAFGERLGGIERKLADQAHDSRELRRESTETLLLATGAFAAAILLGGLLAALILARALGQVSGSLVAALPAGRATSVAGSSLVAAAQLPEGELAEPAVTGRFLGAMERLDRRITELEQTTLGDPTIGGADPAGNGDDRAAGSNGGAYEFSVSALNQKQYALSEPTGRQVPDAAALWLGKGQAMLNLGLIRDAVECFEKAVALNPDYAPDAYVKRGMALEQLQQLEAAIESYDRALAADPTLTLAYLYKGAACNRLQRYREALDCYDQALRCEQRVADSGPL